MEKRINENVSKKIILLSFAMTCLIAIYHTGWNYHLDFRSEFDRSNFIFISRCIDSFAIIAMGYFFMITGFFLYRGLNYKNIKTRLFKRIKTLLLPYIIWNLIYLIYFLSIGGKYTMDVLMIKFIFDPLAGPLWYVFCVFCLSLLSPIVLLFNKNKKVLLISFFALFMLCFYISSIAGNETKTLFEYGWYVERLFRYLPNYFMGALIGLRYEDLLLNEDKKLRIFSIIIILFFMYLIGLGYQENNITWIIYRFLPLLMWYLIPNYSKMLKIKYPMIFSSSFMIFSLHALLIIFVNKLFESFSFIYKYSCGYMSLIVRFSKLFIIVIIPYILYVILKKICPKLLIPLTGGR